MIMRRIVTVILGLAVFMFIILLSVVAINGTNQQFLDFCADKGWEGTHNVTGDFSGSLWFIGFVVAGHAAFAYGQPGTWLVGCTLGVFA